MWEIIWKEKKHAWLNTLLGIGKISINCIAWILAYALYSKSALFVRKAKELMKQPEYLTRDLLGSEKVQMVYLFGEVMMGVIAVGTVILFWCIVYSDMKKRKSGMSFLMTLGYDGKALQQYYIYQIVIDTGISVVVSVIGAWGIWKLFLLLSTSYVEMLEFVGLNLRMDMLGVIYAVIIAMLLQLVALILNLEKVRRSRGR